MKQLGELMVAEVMSTHPICVGADVRLADAIRRFDDYDVSALPVLDEDDTVVGILSIVDLLDVSRELHGELDAAKFVGDKTRGYLLGLWARDEDHTRVSDVMTQQVETVAPRTNAVVAAKLMLQGGFRHLPVVDEDGKAVGILSATDFLKAFAQQAPLLAG